MTSKTRKSLLRLLSNIGSGSHPTACSDSPPSALQFFARMRYADIIKPIVDQEWNAQHQGTFISNPSVSFRETVATRLFETLSSEGQQELAKEAHRAWVGEKERYHREVVNIYGESDADELRRFFTLLHLVSIVLFFFQLYSLYAGNSPAYNGYLRGADRFEV
jgi:hypothetical protein